MNSRGPETPLVLWICAAVCAHFVFAEGGDEVATYHEDRSYIFQLGTRARSAAHGKDLTNERGEVKPEPPDAPKLEAKKDKKPEPPEPKKVETPKKPEAPRQEVKLV